MLFVVFALDADRYAIAADDIAEILPIVRITPIPHAPDAVPGALNYAGQPVPVVDLSRLLAGRPAAARFDTRVVLVHYVDRHGARRLLGLVAEQVSGTMRRDAADFVSSGVTTEAARYLGPVTTDNDGIIQWIDVRTLLPPAVADALFVQAADVTWTLEPSNNS